MSDIEWLQLLMELPVEAVSFILTFKQTDSVDSGWGLAQNQLTFIF